MVIHMPLAYYKGYVAFIEDADGKITQLDVSNYELTKNLIVSSNKILNGKITVEYKMTNIQKISYYITYITLFGLICYILIQKFNIKKIKMLDNKEQNNK